MGFLKNNYYIFFIEYVLTIVTLERNIQVIVVSKT